MKYEKTINEIIDFCEKYNVTSFYALSKYAFSHSKHEWKNVLTDNCTGAFMREFLKNKQWSIDNNQIAIKDPNTREIIK